MEHLKRIRSSKQEGGANLLEIIVCPEADFEASVPEDIKSSLTGAHVVSVARFAPHSRPEFLEWGQLWPIQFRPSETDRSREQGLDDKETARLSRYIEMLEAIDKLLEGETGLKNQGVIIVNPSNGAIITTSHCAFTEEVSLRGREAALAHPLHTPVMRCINDVGNVLVNRPPGNENRIHFCLRLFLLPYIPSVLQTDSPTYQWTNISAPDLIYTHRWNPISYLPWP